MALHLNLYHEIQTQNLQRQRDPLKLGMLVLLVVAIGFVGYYFYRLQGSAVLNNQAARLQTDWLVLEPKAKQAEEREAELLGRVKLKEALVSRMEDRCLWGPILDCVGQGVPREVQLKSLEAGRVMTGEKGGRVVTFVLSGIACGVEPRRSAEDFRVAFMRRLSDRFRSVNSVPKDGFRSLDDKDERVELDGQNYPTAAFVVSYEASLDEAAPAPTPAKTRRGR
jgi:hypothetical protein